MSEKTIEDLIDIPPEDMMGPAMLALNERQRRFVCALAIFGCEPERAYAWAGYNVKTPGSLQANASRLHNTEAVQEALREEATRRFNSAPLMVMSGLLEMCSPVHNPDRKLRLKALQDAADRLGYGAKTEHVVTVKDDRTTNAIMASIMQMAIANGLDPKMLTAPGGVIDAQYSEVNPDDLSDIL